MRVGAAGRDGLVRPMLATAGPVPRGPGWAFEVKFDGVRAIGYTHLGGLRLYSRNDRDVSRSYPEIAALDLEPGLVTDGELVASDERGRPDFGPLQQRMHLTAPTTELLTRIRVQYLVFDVLRRGDRSLTPVAFAGRVATSQGARPLRGVRPVCEERRGGWAACRYEGRSSSHPRKDLHRLRPADEAAVSYQ